MTTGFVSRFRPWLAAGLLIAAPLPAWAQARTDTLTPTIPADQIEALNLATTYEFLSTSTGIDEFQAKLAQLAASAAQSTEIKAFAEKMAAEHVNLAKGAAEAGKQDNVEIAAATIDGEQQGLLTKLEGLKGPDFDRAFVEAQVFVHQRAVAAYKGYAKQNNHLGQFAAANLPAVIGHYEEAVALAKTLDLGGAAQTTE